MLEQRVRQDQARGREVDDEPGHVDQRGEEGADALAGSRDRARNTKGSIEPDSVPHRLLRDVLRERPDRAIDRDFVLEAIVLRMPRENYERVFNTLVRWARFGDLFLYDPATQRLSLESEP